jgi:PII-like signaling protein
MHGLEGDRVLMRIHIGESDRWNGQALCNEIVDYLRREHYAGATVFRGIAGFGAHARLHQPKLFRLSSDLPIVIECIDTQEKIDRALPVLDSMIGGGLITLERVHVIMYRPDLPVANRDGEWNIDLDHGLGTP